MRMQGVIQGITAGTVGYDEAPRSPRISHAADGPASAEKRKPLNRSLPSLLERNRLAQKRSLAAPFS